METEKSRNLQSAICKLETSQWGDSVPDMRAGAADDVVSSPGLKPWEPRALRQKTDVSVQAMSQEGREKLLLFLPFLFLGPSDN